MTANQIQTGSFSTAFTAPGYDHAWSEKQAGLRRRAALHDIERPVAPRRMFDSWAPDEEKKQLGTEHKQRVQQFEHAVRHESPELGHDATGWDVERHWYDGMRHALTMGHLSIDEAERRGFRGGEIDNRESGTKDSYWDDDQERHVHTRRGGWQPLPKKLIHVTTDVPAVQREGLKTPGEQKIKGEGSIGLGGASDTVSVTSDHSLGPDIYHSLHEHHAVVTGKIPIDHLLNYAAHPPVGKPFESNLRSQFMPEHLDGAREGTRIHQGMTAPDDGHEWSVRSRHPVNDATRSIYPEGIPHQWHRPATEQEKHEDRSRVYKSFSTSRHYAEGHRDPLFISNDPHRFAQADPQHFGILHLRPHDGAQGYPLSGSGEHHSGADSGEWRLGRGSPFDIEKVEKPEPRHLREFGLKRENSRQGDRSVCPCGTPVEYDETDGWQHADGSISHDGELSGKSVSDLMSRTAAMRGKDYEGETGNPDYITRGEVGELPVGAVAHLRGARGELPGEHRNRQGADWEAFKADIAANGIRKPIFITVDHGEEPKLSEGNHRRDAAVELGLSHIPAEVRYFGHAEQQGTVEQRVGQHTAGAAGLDYDDLRFEYVNHDSDPEQRFLYAVHPQHGDVGSLRYSERPRAVQVHMMRVPSAHRRRGVGTALMGELERSHPGMPIDHGLRSEDGSAWAQHYYGDGQPEDHIILDRWTAARFVPDKRVFTHTDGLDHRLFDGEHLRSEVRSYILGTITAWWADEYRDWSKWAKIFFAGSEASEWSSPTLEGNGDLDILVGVDYDGCRAANPQLAELTDQQITDRMNAGFRTHNSDHVWLPIHLGDDSVTSSAWLPPENSSLNRLHNLSSGTKGEQLQLRSQESSGSISHPSVGTSIWRESPEIMHGENLADGPIHRSASIVGPNSPIDVESAVGIVRSATTGRTTSDIPSDSQLRNTPGNSTSRHLGVGSAADRMSHSSLIMTTLVVQDVQAVDDAFAAFSASAVIAPSAGSASRISSLPLAMLSNGAPSIPLPEGWLWTGPWSRTTFCNPDSYDIQKIKPYAAYDVGADSWVVKPPHLPHWSLSELPKPVQHVLRAADSYARRVLKLPEPERTQQGAALFEAWHTDRSRAFSERGEGWWDIANLREKYGDQAGWWAQLVDCAHRAKQGLDAAPADWSNIPTGYVTAASRSETGAYPSRVSHHELERLVPGYDPEEHAFSDPSLRRATFSYVDRFPVRSLPEAEPTSPEFYAHSVDHDSEQERQDHLEEMRELGDVIKQNPHSVPPIVVDHTRGFPLLDGSHRSARHLWTDGDYNEWGYHGPDVQGEIHTRGRQATRAVTSMMEAPREGPLPHSPGRLFYRVHPVKRGWSQENASSQPFGGGGPYGDEGEELPREHGYSAFDNPHDLGRYLNAMDWHRHLPRLPRTREDCEEGRQARVDPHKTRVVQFPGEIVGQGHDGEHLVRPHARADRQEMDYETFQHRLGQTPHPDVAYHWHKSPYEQVPEWAEGNGHDCDPGGQGSCHNDYSEEAHEMGMQPTHHWASKEASAQLWITPQLVMGSAAGLNHARQVNSANEAVAAVQQGLTAVLPPGAWFPVRQVLLGLGMSLLDVTQRLKQFGAPSSVTG